MRGSALLKAERVLCNELPPTTANRHGFPPFSRPPRPLRNREDASSNSSRESISRERERDRFVFAPFRVTWKKSEYLFLLFFLFLFLAFSGREEKESATFQTFLFLFKLGRGEGAFFRILYIYYLEKIGDLGDWLEEKEEKD